MVVHQGKRRAFLAAYLVWFNVRQAALAARISRRAHYYWLRDPEYAKAFAEVKQQVLDLLEDEAYRRGVEGYLVPVIYKGELCYGQKRIKVKDRRTGKIKTKIVTEKQPLMRREYSDKLLLYLLQSRKPDVYR